MRVGQFVRVFHDAFDLRMVAGLIPGDAHQGHSTACDAGNWLTLPRKLTQNSHSHEKSRGLGPAAMACLASIRRGTKTRLRSWFHKVTNYDKNVILNDWYFCIDGVRIGISRA